MLSHPDIFEFLNLYRAPARSAWLSTWQGWFSSWFSDQTPLDFKGACYGYSSTYLLFALKGKQDRFWRLMDILNDYRENKESLIRNIQIIREKRLPWSELEQGEKELLNIPALFEMMIMFQDPELYREILDADMSMADVFLSQDFLRDLPFVLPSWFKTPPVRLHRSYHAYTEYTDLLSLLLRLELMFRVSKTQFPILITSGRHALCLEYMRKKEKWMLVDINAIDDKEAIRGPHLDDYIGTAIKIVHAFNHNNEKQCQTTFSMAYIALTDDLNLRNVLRFVSNDVTVLNVNQKCKRGTSLLELAIARKDVDGATRLIQNGFDFNESRYFELAKHYDQRIYKQLDRARQFSFWSLPVLAHAQYKKILKDDAEQVNQLFKKMTG